MSISTLKDAPAESKVEYYRFYFADGGRWRGTDKYFSLEDFEKEYPHWRQIDPHVLRKFTVITIV